MKIRNILASALVVGSLMASTAFAETVVKVTLIDKMGTPDLSKPLGLGMGMKADMSTAKMGININPKTAAPGNVRFDVTNLASNLVHEVLIAQITDENQLLPFDQGRNKVDEEAVRSLGSVSEIDPNKTASLTLDLKPGKYLLYCNVAGHYMAGMWTVIEIK
ncbi:MAG: hypothetical protein WCN98_00875 [Verrucomicrobiaceae bacterium]|uniref:hypothetical protein n=1 Tax=Aestuariivirga sp. TaxID=2650926 RepID=UPI00301AE775